MNKKKLQNSSSYARILNTKKFVSGRGVQNRQKKLWSLYRKIERNRSKFLLPRKLGNKNKVRFSKGDLKNIPMSLVKNAVGDAVKKNT